MTRGALWGPTAVVAGRPARPTKMPGITPRLPPTLSVSGVTVYVSDFKRSLPDKLASNFFDEPSVASVTCAATGRVSPSPAALAAGPSGVDVFAERKGLSLVQNKTLRVRRIVDSKRGAVIYIAYSTRVAPGAGDSGAGRFRSSVCALPLSPAEGEGMGGGESKGGPGTGGAGGG